MRLLATLGLFSFCIFASELVAEETTHTVTLEVDLKCPYSQELQNLIDSIPSNERNSPEWEEWKQSFVSNMQRLIELVESDKVGNSSWAIHVSPSQDSPE